MSKLWAADGKQLHPFVEKYTVGDDPVVDLELLPHDIIASKAHARGLIAAGVLSQADVAMLCAALDDFAAEVRAGRVSIRQQDEDCHTVIENYLVGRLGDLGKRIHTGRSRNDQVLTALRLYMKDGFSRVTGQLRELATDVLNFVERYQYMPMPGYSHTQQAMLSTVGHWAASLLESLLDDLDYIKSCTRFIDCSPLGSAAGFGVALSLPRDAVATELGFSRIQLNSLYCQASRGKFERAYVEAMGQIMATLGRFAADLLFFTSRECAFFAVAPELTTGSSIMPQKRNVDVLEIMRAKAARSLSHYTAIVQTAHGLISGYHRDYQLLKRPIIEATNDVTGSVEAATLVIQGIIPVPEKIRAAIVPDIVAADVATSLAKEQGIPFRDAYKLAMARIPEGGGDFEANIAAKISPGAPGNLGLDVYRERLASYRV